VRPILAPPPQGPIEPGPTPSFSVIIAAYQAADSVGNAVSSALDQTVAPHEVIVCDDGSTDDIEGALESFGDRIVLLRQENRGEGPAKNAAARAASGDYVVILDADDVFMPERIEALGEVARARPDLDVLVTNALIEVDGHAARRLYDEERRFDVRDQRSAILEGNFVSHPAVRRSRYLEAGGYGESRLTHNDWECFIRLIFTGSSVGLVEQPLLRWRVHAGAMSSDQADAAIRRVATLELATADLDMSPSERAVLERSLARHRREAALMEAKQALRDGAPDARRRSMAIARDRDYPLTSRLKALAGALSPRIMGRLLARQDRRWYVGAGNVRVRRPRGSA
jgi:glycosyltransferase involved in cell wall biosynthesis